MSQDLSEKENCNQKNGQREPQISMTSPVIKPENSETEVKGNETTGIVFVIWMEKGIEKKKHEKGYKFVWCK